MTKKKPTPEQPEKPKTIENSVLRIVVTPGVKTEETRNTTTENTENEENELIPLSDTGSNEDNTYDQTFELLKETYSVPNPYSYFEDDYLVELLSNVDGVVAETPSSQNTNDETTSVQQAEEPEQTVRRSTRNNLGVPPERYGWNAVFLDKTPERKIQNTTNSSPLSLRNMLLFACLFICSLFTQVTSLFQAIAPIVWRKNAKPVIEGSQLIYYQININHLVLSSKNSI